MKVNEIKIFYFMIVLAASVFFNSCGKPQKGDLEEAETSPAKERNIREYNLDVEKEQAAARFPCDTLSFQQYLISEFPAGTYLVEFNKTFTYSIPKPAVLYYEEKGKRYVFAALARSKEGERFVETKNLVGYESSFINLDSTKLGTAFFFLSLFECDADEKFHQIWEAEIPIHGGFNAMRLKTWKERNKKIKYIELNFEAGIISGHRNYNFFMIDGLERPPHLMETYEGLVHLRNLRNVNQDKYPDYMEYLIRDSSLAIYDSIPFYWDTTKSLYVTNRNKRWYRKY